ncbi:MAG: sigma 54-interacting transcriptional regulator [Fuerstiella sp.]|nr:sigma 54-interacting transcriptional regulator [Fuerstiella sp.]
MPLLVAFSVIYALIVLWYVATFPELGMRCLFPKTLGSKSEKSTVTLVKFSGESIGYVLGRGDELVSINDRPVRTFLDFLSTTGNLRSAKLLSGATLPPGSDPTEATEQRPLVEILHPETNGAAVRYVRVEFQRRDAGSPQAPLITYVAVKPPNTSDVLLTVFWFLCQSAILLVALTGFWQRPSDSVAQTFCIMSSFTMVAFVGGFHWWIIAGDPLLNIPFIICTAGVPACTLHFFLKFPREVRWLTDHRRRTLAGIYAPMGLVGLLITFIYWSAFCLNGNSGASGLSPIQQLAGVARCLVNGGDASLPSTAVSWQLLFRLRQIIYCSIVIAGLYFGATVVSIVFGRLRTQTVIEHRQASTIFKATIFSTPFVIWTIYLAFYSKDVFVLGGSQFPMFVASGSFMAAFAHGMLKHRLILADEKLHRGRSYRIITVVVTAAFAGLLAAGIVSASQYSIPGNSSLALRLSLYLILVVAVSFALWMRDRLQAAIDLRFFSEKYQLDRALNQLNQAAGHLTDPTAMANMTLRTCREVVDASSAMMFVREGTGAFRLVGAYDAPEAPSSIRPDQIALLESSEPVVLRVPAFSRETLTGVQQQLDEMGSELIFTLRDDQGLAGAIYLGRRASNTAYSAEDIAFLRAIGQMTVLALHSSRANQNLARLTSELQVKVDHISEQQRQLSMLRAELMSIDQPSLATGEVAIDHDFDRSQLRGTSSAIAQILETTRKAALSTSTVLIRGESGTGKELLARVIQRNSRRSSEPFVSVNCAALAPSLLESELFGHVRGAFTGAESSKPGRFQAADGGTLFLDEIGDISLETQVRLLRVLQERSFEPVGSDKSISIDVRVIAATHRNLEEMIRGGTFREDLYYRLNVVSITLPPLRDRREDLIELVFCFLKNAVTKTGKHIRQIDPNALAALEAYSWPGNIRELENAIERAVVLADGDTLQLADLPDDIVRSTEIVIDSVTTAGNQPSVWMEDSISSAPVVQTSLETSLNSTQEYSKLVDALAAADGNKALAARRLKMPRSTFYSRLKKFGIDGSEL